MCDCNDGINYLCFLLVSSGSTVVEQYPRHTKIAGLSPGAFRCVTAMMALIIFTSYWLAAEAQW